MSSEDPAHHHEHGGDEDKKGGQDSWNDGAKEYDDMGLATASSVKCVELILPFMKKVKPYSFNAGSGLKVLEFGCGPGKIILGLSELVSEGVGMDLAPNMISIFEAAIESKGLSAKYRGQVLQKSDASELPNAYYDLVLCPFVLHHCSEPSSILKRLVEAVMPSGHLILAELVGMELSKELQEEKGVHGWLDEAKIDGLLEGLQLPNVKKVEAAYATATYDGESLSLVLYVIERVAV
uniref:Methyltransferase type 11 domain-containing protein n=1 Tax=Rhodosorus marinus TaxID=101924 RepID=A0A7S3E678_9RHOD|mmetsp:Transcript_12103/g.50279  ORF Transcript_12103/g.50279 Transcript_12103/m.50279 type:complete len:237 (+) Transcript_12103:159-869(+)|eukprot:CAMPEP_0113964624 /NCGR_PEP_ID=MMETSP0011_2-20120614/7258_1 /TAXON_ID=101924 /ORGANISM="Rhodosorus marinus" /LENGTH=236 /DNA_ID=CAMNT_0000976977 /DNA_START=84 /DNA_END=794 /DNA_ORIENTATION=+ /assembly_acc=CAM_ASM_000156